MKKSLVSVVITNYNYGSYIADAIESIFNQTYPNIELIIINDGSTDDSDAVIKKIISKNKSRNINYINRENKGVVYTRNEGIEVSKGKYISYLDADDYFNPDYIEKSYAIAEEFNADVVYPNWHFVGEWLGKPDTDFPEFTNENLQLQKLHCTPASLIRKSAIGCHRFEAEKVAEDWDFFIGLSLEGVVFKLAKNNHINYRIRSGTRSSQLDPDEDIKYFVEILEKYKKKYADKVIDPQQIADRIYSLRHPSVRQRLLSVDVARKVAGSMRREGVKSTARKIGATLISRNPTAWNLLGHVRNKRYYSAVKMNSAPSQKTDAKLAVVLHLYYPDRWPAIKEKLSRIDVPFDLFVSVQPHDSGLQLDAASQYHLSTSIVSIPNRGRDVLPFLVILKEIAKSGQYEYLLKLHSKKSPHRPDGDQWIDSLLDQLIPSSVVEIVKTLSKADTGMVGPADHVVSLSRYMGGNRDKMLTTMKLITDEKKTLAMLGDASKYPFFGGTMFWSRIDLFDPILNSELTPVDFSSERGQVDATTAHALERIFGAILHDIAKKKMYSVKGGAVKKLQNKEYTSPYKYAD